MKLTPLSAWLCCAWSVLASCITTAEAQDYAPPTYRGKIVLVVDATLASDATIGSKINRLMTDLVGDGWRVLRHDVERGPEPPQDPQTSGPTLDYWLQQNAPRVREVRSLIKADYDSSPGEVKAVFLIGHVPVPYSGKTDYIAGGHYSGSAPADLFYGDMITGYDSTGWSDSGTPVPALTDFGRLWQFDNLPGDGRFDPSYAPCPLQLGVGRIDLSHMDGFLPIGETILLSQYLEKDHDFRCAVFTVQSHAIVVQVADSKFDLDDSGINTLVGSANVYHDRSGAMHWFSAAYGDVQQKDYLIGYAGGWGGGSSAFGIGVTYNDGETDVNLDAANNNFVDFDSRVVFLNLYGSWFGPWEQPNDFLRAPLANPYDPANGRFGCGLAVVYDRYGLDSTTLQKRALGAPIGEALFTGTTPSVNVNLLGDPSLRLHAVVPPTGLSLSKSGSTITVSWNLSASASGYNIYRGPTRHGPFMMVNTTGPITDSPYTAPSPSVGDPPDNFYMVRAVRNETTAFGSYLNMSEGVIAQVPGAVQPYLAVLSGPSAHTMAADIHDNVSYPAAFAVDALGINESGSEELTYTWTVDHNDGNGEQTLSDGAGTHIKGALTSGLLIRDVSAADGGTYKVTVGFADGSGSPQAASASLLVDPALPIARNDAFTLDSGRAADLSVLDNDSNFNSQQSSLTVVSVSALSDPSAGTLTINSDSTIHFTPIPSLRGQVMFSYTISDGIFTAQALVTLTVLPTDLSQQPFSPGSLSDNSFSFNVTEPSGTLWEVYRSSDLNSWSLAGEIAFGASGTAMFTDNSVNNVNARFYRLVNGTASTRSIGFIRVHVGAGTQLLPGTHALISNPLEGLPDNTLASVFAQSSLPDGTMLEKFNGHQFNVTYSYTAGQWSANPTFGPGEAAFLVVSTATEVRFVGLVPEGHLVRSLQGGLNAVGSLVPQIGGVKSVLEYQPSQDDEIQQWTGSGYAAAVYDPLDYPPDGWADRNGNPGSEPTISLGEGFVINLVDSPTETWTRDFTTSPESPASPPSVGNAILSGSSFSFAAKGVPGSYWDIYSSDDLLNWTLAGGLTLGSDWTTYSDSSIGSRASRFYRLGSGTLHSRAIGFVKVQVGAGTQLLPGTHALISNPLEGLPDNTLASVFAQSSLPDGTMLEKFNGHQFNVTYSYTAGQWSANPTFGPGEAAFLVVSTATEVRFVGLVPEGHLVRSLQGGLNAVGSLVPQIGGVKSVLEYQPSQDDEIQQWTGSGYAAAVYDPLDYPPDGWADRNGNPGSEPTISLGEGFVINLVDSPTETWTRDFH
jgi:Bacterial Ig domain